MNLTTPEKNPADNETWNNHRSIDTIQEQTGSDSPSFCGFFTLVIFSASFLAEKVLLNIA